MIISNRMRFVILAPWKTASTTVRARLGGYCESPYDVFYYFNPVLKRVVHQHLIYADFAALPESRLGYRTAAFVRNPYDRVYSAFCQLQRDIREQPAAVFPAPEVRTLVMEQLAENFSQLCRASFEFEPWLELIDDHQVLEVGRNTSFPLHPAHYWTHHDGGQAVDFIGRVENFESDFNRLCATLGIEVESRVNANVTSDDGEPVSDPHGYRHIEGMSPRARRRINELFCQDFELLGYPRVE
jgi:sulfotransferase famil protein